MADILCGYTADRDETLIAYLYGEIDPAQRVTFEGHIATCERCRNELADLQGVRLRLQEWPAPELARPFVRIPAGAAIHADLPAIASIDGNDGPRATARERGLPVWAQTAAALLFLGVSAGIANLDVHYDQQRPQHPHRMVARRRWVRSRRPRARRRLPFRPPRRRGAPT